VEWTLVIGYALALVIGCVLGILGGGGAMLAVPVLVYLFGETAEQATAYSLFIIGITSLVSTIPSTIKGLVNYRSGLVFALPALMVGYGMRWVVNALPDAWLQGPPFSLTKDFAIMVFFVMVMIPVGWTMVRKQGVVKRPAVKSEKTQFFQILLQGAATGLVTGFAGAGGGFLIVPALTLLVGLPIRQAIATSLMIVTLNTLTAFGADLQAGRQVNWPFLLSFTGLTVVGILIGGLIIDRLPAQKLKLAFGYFIFLMAAVILTLEVVGLRK
jgi:hypothetical protein